MRTQYEDLRHHIFASCTVATDSLFHRDEKLCEAGADLVILSAPSSPDSGGPALPWVFKVKRSTLQRCSQMWSDMLDIGSSDCTAAETVDGLPSITVTEEPGTLETFLRFFDPEPDTWPDIDEQSWHDDLLLWELSIKYQVGHVRYLCERDFVEVKMVNVQVIDPEVDLPILMEYYSKARLAGRDYIKGHLLHVMKATNLQCVDPKMLEALPAKALSQLYEARIDHLKLSLESKSHRLTRIAGHLTSALNLSKNARTDAGCMGNASVLLAASLKEIDAANRLASYG